MAEIALTSGVAVGLFKLCWFDVYSRVKLNLNNKFVMHSKSISFADPLFSL